MTIPNILLLSDDLIFTSRICATGTALGLPVRAARSVNQLEQFAAAPPPECVIVDLGHPELTIATLVQHLRQGREGLPRIVAYGSHVHAEALRAARDAGCDVVLPRSKFVEELPRELPAWCGQRL